jgi:N utilization substance protein B
MGLRRRSRELTLQFLFQDEFTSKTTPSDAFRRFVEHFAVDREVMDYAGDLVNGIVARKNEIDAMIQAHSSHWKIPRMALVDVNVMRIAVFEMKFMNPPVPVTVAINEAVEIAKKYGSTDSGAFVNGILDHIAKELR